MISHFPFVWLLWKLFFVNVHFSSFFPLHLGIQEGKSVSKWKDIRTKDNLIKWKWHMLGVFTFFFNINILMLKSLHIEFVCYIGLSSISDHYCLKKVFFWQNQHRFMIKNFSKRGIEVSSINLIKKSARNPELTGYLMVRNYRLFH